MVENYYNVELENVSFNVEALEEWKELAGALGMKNQLGLSKNDKSPIPYPFLNTTMKRVYETLCPRMESYNVYRKTAIPLEVLKQIAFCKKEEFFNDIHIWYDDKTPDPIVVGTRLDYYCWDYKDEFGNRVYFKSREDCENEMKGTEFEGLSIYSDETQYLIARWGDELIPFDSLKTEAQKRLVDSVGNELSKAKKEISDALNLLSENVNSYLDGEIDMYKLKANRF